MNTKGKVPNIGEMNLKIDNIKKIVAYINIEVVFSTNVGSFKSKYNRMTETIIA